METQKENTENSQKTSTGMAGMPEWVMHLLTGLGTMGADFLLFIKPLQDKFEIQSKQIKEQEERIEELEDKLEAIIRKPEKKEQHREYNRDHSREQDEDLFNLKKRQTITPKFQKSNYAKL